MTALLCVMMMMMMLIVTAHENTTLLCKQHLSIYRSIYLQEKVIIAVVELTFLEKRF